MSVQTTTHLNFRGDAREALAFYQSVFGGHLVVNTYADFAMPAEIPGSDKVVFGRVAAENGFRLMGYDIPGRTEGGIAGGGATHRENNATVTDQAVFVSISCPTLEELRGLLGWVGGGFRDRRAAGGFGVERGVRDADGSVGGDVERICQCNMRRPC
ncbi:VOC family protein [Microbacterium trichothecenolyticum]|uniref:Catechol 2,3-dioxygenase-like lactoylglutathione lyase family enzyme n=1 Tax=Microbacterium trichothecenolyticum TaxID=69370 RepID=A0ABU0TWH7_MICTR|nr:VOC family protein [Microbacterium trichothecenolyticum]MDQ1124016.1 catechol 2,3-dioxygenase-like lactoylglutathione lyase family enzyme [Microbacterium trichothecenolyticum]